MENIVSFVKVFKKMYDSKGEGMIPKVIHYCWFGGGKKSELIEKCIASWRKFCPDCEIVEWNESNYDVSKNKYMYQAYQEKRWGFVPDYARLDIIYNHGGIYLDTDVELIRNIDNLFDGDGFMGFESTPGQSEKCFVNTGQGFGAPAHNEIIKKMRDLYENLEFVNSDGTLNLQPSPFYNTMALMQEGLKQKNVMQIIGKVTVYPADYMCPIDWRTQKCTITSNTISIHHFNASWLSESEKKRRKRERQCDYVKHLPNMIIKKILGDEYYEKLKKSIKRVK